MSEFEKVMPRLAQDGFEKEQSIFITWKSDENGKTDVACCLNCASSDAVKVIASLVLKDANVGKIMQVAVERARNPLIGLFQELEKRFSDGM